MDSSQNPDSSRQDASSRPGSSIGWLRRPQNVWLRRAIFQVHLWTGIVLGLYVLVISVSGSAIVFRNEIYKVADHGPVKVQVKGERLSNAALTKIAEGLYPGDSVSFVFPGRDTDSASEVWMDHNGGRNQRLFDPYTGADLGPSVPYPIQVTAWFTRLHTDLLGGETGRTINGIASIVFTLLCVTGAIVWWPGVEKWKRSLWVNPRSGWKRINWDLHSAVGFWTFGLVFMWAVTGIFVVWPKPIERVIHRVSPLIQYAPLDDEASVRVPVRDVVAMPNLDAQPGPDGSGKGDGGGGGFGRGGFGKGFGKGFGRPPIRRSPSDIFVRWLYYLHFGNFAGNGAKAVWVVLGLLPALLFVTGTIMWWNRVLSPSARRARRAGGAR